MILAILSTESPSLQLMLLIFILSIVQWQDESLLGMNSFMTSDWISIAQIDRIHRGCTPTIINTLQSWFSDTQCCLGDKPLSSVDFML